MKFVCLLVLFFSVRAVASQADCSEAKKVVSKYLELESKGETTHQSNEVDKLVSYGGRDTAGFDTVVVVSNSTLKDCTSGKDGLNVMVNYAVQGTISEPYSEPELQKVLSSRVTNEEFSFKMVQEKKAWKIDSRSIGQPHIKAETAKKLAKLTSHLKEGQ